jgi:hypothetical protein
VGYKRRLREVAEAPNRRGQDFRRLAKGTDKEIFERNEMTTQEIKKNRAEAKALFGKYGSLEVTWTRFDCEMGGCGECKVCKYLNFHEWASSVAPSGSTIERNVFLDKYLKLVYGIRA